MIITFLNIGFAVSGKTTSGPFCAIPFVKKTANRNEILIQSLRILLLTMIIDLSSSFIRNKLFNSQLLCLKVAILYSYL